MKILVDADACPVKNLIEQEAKAAGIPVWMFIDTSHELRSKTSRIITVDKGPDSVDLALMNQAEKGDLIVSQDYGVASLALGRGCFCLNQNGLVYTLDNIDSLLFERHQSAKIRRGGGHTGHFKKRTREQDEAFLKSFRELLKKARSLPD